MTIYFARATALGHIKIGYVQDVRGSAVDDRLQQVGRLVGSPMELLATTPGKRRVERWFHQRHAATALGGEWFSPSTELHADIDRLRLGKVVDGTPEALPYSHHKHYRWWEVVTPPGGRPYFAARRVKPRDLRNAVDCLAKAA